MNETRPLGASIRRGLPLNCRPTIAKVAFVDRPYALDLFLLGLARLIGEALA